MQFHLYLKSSVGQQDFSFSGEKEEYKNQGTRKWSETETAVASWDSSSDLSLVMSCQPAILFAEPFYKEQPLKTFSFLSLVSMNIDTERRKEA